MDALECGTPAPSSNVTDPPFAARQGPMHAAVPPSPLLDPELAAVLRARPYLSASVLPEHIDPMRIGAARLGASDAALARGGKVAFRELTIPASGGAGELPLLLLAPAGASAPRPGICFLHGGGMISGDARTGVDVLVDWVEALGVAVASVGYRLAPEHPHPAPLEDCYAALAWIAANRAALGMADGPLILAGTSAGGGLAAGVTLLARERGGPAIADQILMGPMLDDRALLPSSTAFAGDVPWDARSNRTGWEALLGPGCGGPGIPACAAPAREADLAGLPAAYIDAGAVETFRDEAVDYAARLMRAGVPVELHVWAGAFHGFDLLAPDSAVARSAKAARIDYLRRRLAAREAA